MKDEIMLGGKLRMMFANLLESATDWNASETYRTGMTVVGNNGFWQSQIEANKNNALPTPPNSSTVWKFLAVQTATLAATVAASVSAVGRNTGGSVGANTSPFNYFQDEPSFNVGNEFEWVSAQRELKYIGTGGRYRITVLVDLSDEAQSMMTRVEKRQAGGASAILCEINNKDGGAVLAVDCLLAQNDLISVPFSAQAATIVTPLTLTSRITVVAVGGTKGDKGDTGGVPNITVGNTTTGAAGSNASVTRRANSPDTAPIFDWVIPQGLKGDTGNTGNTGAQGNSGWSPVLANEADGQRRVLRVVDWTGGAGTKPTTGQYIGTTGLVATAAAATDIRGATGQTGGQGILGRTIITASGTFTVPTGVSIIRATCIGGGGGGGSSTAFAGGTAGGSGGTSSLARGATVLIDAFGGGGGSLNNGTTGGQGGSGASSFQLRTDFEHFAGGGGGGGAGATPTSIGGFGGTGGVAAPAGGWPNKGFAGNGAGVGGGNGGTPADGGTGASFARGGQNPVGFRLSTNVYAAVGGDGFSSSGATGGGGAGGAGSAVRGNLAVTAGEILTVLVGAGGAAGNAGGGSTPGSQGAVVIEC
jgi:hypothetical protein